VLTRYEQHLNLRIAFLVERMAETDSLTTTSLLAAASGILEKAGYSRISDEQAGTWPTSTVRLYEDPYGIVSVVTYETWSDLSSGWMDAQASLVELISKHLVSSEAKAWEGYLVLLTPNPRAAGAVGEAARIDRDTSRVRKLLATGDELQRLSDVETILLPLLPLSTEEVMRRGQESVLDMLPALLSRRALEEEDVRVIIRAFTEHEPLVESLHVRRTSI
jgi:hypothetical protein